MYVFFIRGEKGWSSRLIRFLGRSDLTHCCIGDRWTTIDFKFDGPRFWRTDQFIQKYPNLVVMVRIPVDAPLVPQTGIIPIWRTVVRWMFHLPIQAHDCVQQTARMLREAGVDVPRVTTPDDLLAALQVSAYTLQALTLDANFGVIPSCPPSPPSASAISHWESLRR